jgi:hypothetical protein
MDDVRRGKIGVIVRILERLQEQVHQVWLEEDEQFESRSSKESHAAHFSEHLGNAVEHLQQTIDALQDAAGDDNGGK